MNFKGDGQGDIIRPHSHLLSTEWLTIVAIGVQYLLNTHIFGVVGVHLRKVIICFNVPSCIQLGIDTQLHAMYAANE